MNWHENKNVARIKTQMMASHIPMSMHQIVTMIKSAQRTSGRILNALSMYLSSVLHILFFMRVFIVSLLIFVSSVIIIYCTISFFAYPLNHKSIIKKHGEEFNIDPVLIASVIKAESNFKTDAVSKKGAVGLMQIMPSTADYIAKKMNVDEFDLKNPNDNIRIGTFYLRYLFDRFGDMRTVLMAYNAGEGNVTRWLDGRVRLDTCPYPETNAYVDRVINAMNYYKFRL